MTSTDGFTPFVAARPATAIAKAAPVVDRLLQVRYDLAKIDGKKSQYLSGIDPATISQTYKFDWKTGSDATLNQLKERTRRRRRQEVRRAETT